MLAGFLFLLLLTDGVSSERNCSYQDVVDYLNLTNNKDLFSLTRPVKNYKQPTEVELVVALYGILDVREKDQKLVPYVWIDMWWKNEFIAWDPEEFCGIQSFSFPAEFLWKPDITIHEMTEKDMGPRSPYLTVHSDGYIGTADDKVLISTCRMRIFKFPFDIQSCNLTFKSVSHTDDEIHLLQLLNSERTTMMSDHLIQTQYEWLFINMTVDNRTVNQFNYTQTQIVYTITMRRRSALYIVNFLLPVMFFLILDLASFLISDSGGEKVGFKITVLLAVTVLQLILNEILPATSDRIPLISIYCLGIFSLMMLSLLETIVVIHLLNKDAVSRNNEADQDKSLSEVCGDRQSKLCFHNCFRDAKKLTHSASAVPELLTKAKEESNSQLSVESGELMVALKTLAVVLNNRKEEQKPGYWTRMTKRINKVFFICYVIADTLFLIVLFSIWTSE
ncbi:5-hydroxytryptamine receptor 3A-like [Larimichthys crocea]|uniref:5-hydroxytryptamine receptor 3A-like n=1 Tax=Larimichthys crocea TaxID=215358 RepID=UPI000F5E3D98|nr:5-hydroxytryptamine receptor 3A-like [Larimichthys crocea]